MRGRLVLRGSFITTLPQLPQQNHPQTQRSLKHNEVSLKLCAAFAFSSMHPVSCLALVSRWSLSLIDFLHTTSPSFCTNSMDGSMARSQIASSCSLWSKPFFLDASPGCAVSYFAVKSLLGCLSEPRLSWHCCDTIPSSILRRDGFIAWRSCTYFL